MNGTVDIQSLIESSSGGGIGEVYFIGIGGIGMSAIARYFISLGVKVSGYDKAETPLTKELEREGIAIHYTEDVNAIPKEAVLVVYTPAVPKDHAELVYYQTKGYPVVKRSDVLGAISQGTFNICIAGTHGKTTISTMVAHILRHSGYGCNAFLGGIAVNYGTNFWSSGNNVSVIEADEYDRSFLKLSPDVAVITSMDADHLDIYGDEKTMQDAYVQFGSKVKSGGVLIGKFGLGRLKETVVENRWTYSLQNNAAHIYAAKISIEDGGYRFDIHLQDRIITDCRLPVGGMHNVENAVAAVAAASTLDIDSEKIVAALADFKGVKRRFEYVVPPKSISRSTYIQPVLVDDYAHHPEELRALLTSVRTLFPQRIVTVVFQPHLFTRTRDLANGFASVLSIADRVILLPIYPAREQPIEGVSSEMVLDGMEKKDKQVLTKEEFINWMKNHKKVLDKEFGEVIVMAGAGDIDTLVGPVKEIMEG
jgi:UDP-N-acetylmuramate--alanine ligase